MILYFFRHAIAEPANPPDVPDEQRALTPKGVARTRAAAQAMAALGVRLTRLYSSPLVRARQTAELLAPALKVTVDVRPGVGPGFSLRALETLIADLNADDEVLFVGHEPDFSSAVSELIGGGEVVMKKGGVARVDVVSFRPLRGALVWLLAPKVFDVMDED